MEEGQINLRRALEIPAGCPPEDLRWLVEQTRSCQRVLELGTLHGRSARAILDNSKAQLWCVDSWRGSGASIPGGPRGRRATEKDYQEFLENIRDVRDRVTILKMTTGEAVRRLLGISVDMVFIDANHSYQGVKFDIIHFAPLVKIGGILCGHDYNRNWPGVVQAVTELIVNPQRGGKNLWWTRVVKNGCLRNH